MNNKELKVGDKVKVVYKEGIRINDYFNTNKSNCEIEIEYNNKIGEIISIRTVVCGIRFYDNEIKQIFRCLCEPVIEEKSNELLVDSIQENNIYLLVAKDNSMDGYVKRDKYYISKQLNITLNAYLINDIYYPIHYFEKPTIIKETIITYIKDVKPADLFTGKKSDNELSLPLIKKALFDIKWLENDDCEDIWKELQSNINKSLNEPLIEVKEEIEDNFILPKYWCVKTTPETRKIVEKFIIEKGYHSYLSADWFIHYPFKPSGGSAYGIPQNNYKEITFEQFKKYVLKQ